MNNTPCASLRIVHGICLWAAGWIFLMATPATAQSDNPISRMARLVNPELVKMEDRYDWLEERIRSMAAYYEHPLRFGIGARGHRKERDSADPVVILDLGGIHPLDRIYLVPAQREYIGDIGIFPRLFTLDIATQEDFSDAITVFTTDYGEFANPNGRPMLFRASEVPARYLRLTVHRGHNNKGWIDKFGLAEIIAIADGDVVSFGAPVTMSDALDSGNSWYPEALTDGRMPHGIWHSGLESNQRGDATLVGQGSDIISWQLDLGESRPLDRVVLFPYKMTTSFESSVIPDRIHLDVRDGPGEEWRTAMVWNNRPASSTCLTPQVMCLAGTAARQVRVMAVEPWQLGDLRIHGLSEIEVWSGGVNIARDLPVTRVRDSVREDVFSLTNGFTSEHMIADIAVWLDQLRDRLQFENELRELRPRLQTVAAESELNVTLASAVLVGLTFLIPVFLYEKRRVNARERLDSLRRRIAADLHDDVGGNLGSISLIARSARRDVEKLDAPPRLVHDLDEVECIARESSLAMRDIVWLLEQRDDSVGDLVHRMQQTSERMLRDVKYDLVCHSKRTNSKLSLDFKRNFYLFFKEALHNIQKHAAAHHVSIFLDDDGDLLVLEIQDDGIGMPKELVDRPETARKLKGRAAAMGGEFSISSAKSEGTCVRLAIRSKSLNTSPRNP